MAETATNRDLYCLIADLVEQRAECILSLQEYLENLRKLARRLGEQGAISLADFMQLLQAAFESPPVEAMPSAAPTPGFVAWEQCVSDQIRDLVEMRQAGTLDNEYRYFGVNAPSGARWFNFDPCTYLECAAAGTFNGWREGDNTGRTYVPGPVATLDASGEVIAVDPRDLEDPLLEFGEIGWELFADFLYSGRLYE